MKKSILSTSLAFTLFFTGAGVVSEAKASEIPAKSEEGTFKSITQIEEPAFDKAAAFKQVNSFHEGEKPVKTIVDKETGVVVDVYSVSQFTTLGAGTWDNKGSELWYMDGNFNTKQYDGVYLSSGGDYMVRVPAHTPNILNGNGHWIRIELWDDDGLYGDDFVSYFEDYSTYSRTTDYVFRNIGWAVDGSYAEFYTVHQTNYTLKNYMYATYYD